MNSLGGEASPADLEERVKRKTGDINIKGGILRR